MFLAGGAYTRERRVSTFKNGNGAQRGKMQSLPFGSRIFDGICIYSGFVIKQETFESHFKF